MTLNTVAYEGAKDILYLLDDYTAIAVNVSDKGVTAGTDGKKIVPAGTVIGGVLEDMTQEAVAADGSTVTAEGILYHDVDVTDGAAVGTMIIRGVIDGKKLPAAVTAAQKATMPMIVVVGEPA